MNPIPTPKIVGVIPARLNSTRLPKKVLRTICGLPMLSYVFNGAAQSPLLSDLLVATDSQEVYAYCKDNKFRVMMTSPTHASGTDRLFEIATQVPGDIFVNVQADEPMIRRSHLESLLLPFQRDASAQVTTLKTPLNSAAARDASVVKVVTDKNNAALYFSRAQIPYDHRGQGEATYFKHIGLYAYTRGALGAFHHLPVSSLEHAEGLEQLRFLENGIRIHVVETPHDTIGVDTEEDLKRVEEFFSRARL